VDGRKGSKWYLRVLQNSPVFSAKYQRCERSDQLRPYVRPVARRLPLAIMGVRSHGESLVKANTKSLIFSIVRIHGLSPLQRSAPVASARIKLTYGRRVTRPHHDPAFGGQELRRARPILRTAFRPSHTTVAHLDPAGLIRPRRTSGQKRDQAAFITAPSITTPAVTYFHSATRSFLARAVIMVFRSRPPFCATRS
jgi:hypothetical protein